MSDIIKPLRILVIEDSEDDAIHLIRELRRGGYEPFYERVDSADAMSSALSQRQWDLVISDYVLPQFSGPAALQLLKETGVDLPFIIVSGNIGEDIAVEAMKAGAHDYIIKGNLKRLCPAVDRELREAEGRHEHSRLKEIRKEKEFIDAVLNNVEMLVIVLNRTGHILSFNKAFEALTGYSVSDVKDHPFWDIFLTPGESKTIETLLNELQAGISPNRHKDYWLTRSRGRRFIEWTYSVVKDTTGSVKYIIGTGIDATDRKHAEEALRDSEERFRLIAETSIDVIFQTDLQGRMTYCSPSISRFGYRADAIVNSHFNDYVPSSELQKVSATFDRVRSGERIDLFELRLCKADGSRVHCEISATPMTKEGRLTGVQGIVRDISARKKIEEDLRMATEDLEFRVLERTADLVKANEDLAKEIAERQDIEKHITATNELLKLFTQTLLRNEYLDKIAVLLRDWCDCDGVGIRLIDEQNNIPYASFSGFSREFWEAESRLSTRDGQCLCPRILSGRPDPKESAFMTQNGSFVCNDMGSFITGLTGEERTRYRKACASHGIASMAIVPIRYRAKVLGSIHLIDRNKDYVSLRLMQFIEPLSPLMGEALYRFYIEEVLMGSRAQLRDLSKHLQDAREEERSRIAREIHDELGQILTAASMELSRIKSKKPLQKPIMDLVLSATQLIDSAVQDIQRICSELRPRVLDLLGLFSAIEWQAKNFSKRSGIKCVLDIASSPAGLPAATSTALFRIFQETLTNVARHAEATEVTVHMNIVGNVLVLEVLDNGKGIKKEKIFGKESFGIMGIHERVHDLGGRVTIKGTRNKGTRVTVEVPLYQGGSYV